MLFRSGGKGDTICEKVSVSMVPLYDFRWSLFGDPFSDIGDSSDENSAVYNYLDWKRCTGLPPADYDYSCCLLCLFTIFPEFAGTDSDGKVSGADT